MFIDFWYSKITPMTNIQSLLENIDETISFKDIDVDLIDTNKLNFLVFKWETSWSFPNTSYTHSDEFITLLIELQGKNFYLISDFSGESHSNVDELSLFFLNKLKLNGIDINRLIVANNNSNNIGVNKVKYENFVLNTIFFPNFFLSTYNHLKNYIGLKNTVTPDKKFLCLNRRMFYHKYKIIEELFNRELLNETRFTWVDNKIPSNMLNKKLITEFNIDTDNFKSIQLEDDVMYGSELSRHDEYLYTINPNWYYKSRVNIITETTLSQSEIHITEKTWKAIYLGVPFVIYASTHHLKTLRDMGFKTFNSVVNEDYDETMGKSKINQIINTALELSNIYNTSEVMDICKFNQELYFNSEHRKQICKDFFLDKLYDVENIINHKSLI
jgi:hypothetical protein